MPKTISCIDFHFLVKLFTFWLIYCALGLLTKSKIGCTAAILDLTKILLDVHQGPIIGHDCAQYE